MAYAMQPFMLVSRDGEKQLVAGATLLVDGLTREIEKAEAGLDPDEPLISLVDRVRDINREKSAISSERGRGGECTEMAQHNISCGFIYCSSTRPCMLHTGLSMELRREAGHKRVREVVHGIEAEDEPLPFLEEPVRMWLKERLVGDPAVIEGSGVGYKALRHEFKQTIDIAVYAAQVRPYKEEFDALVEERMRELDHWQLAQEERGRAGGSSDDTAARPSSVGGQPAAACVHHEEHLFGEQQ